MRPPGPVVLLGLDVVAVQARPGPLAVGKQEQWLTTALPVFQPGNYFIFLVGLKFHKPI